MPRIPLQWCNNTTLVQQNNMYMHIAPCWVDSHAVQPAALLRLPPQLKEAQGASGMRGARACQGIDAGADVCDMEPLAHGLEEEAVALPSPHMRQQHPTFRAACAGQERDRNAQASCLGL